MKWWVWVVMWLSLSSGWKWVLTEGVGVNWGTRSTHPLPADIVVGMLKDNGISKVKLFDAEKHAVRALANTGIEVMVGIPNDQLQIMATSTKAAINWVESNVTEFKLDGGVNISCTRHGVDFHSYVIRFGLAILGLALPTSIWIWCSSNIKKQNLF